MMVYICFAHNNPNLIKFTMVIISRKSVENVSQFLAGTGVFQNLTSTCKNKIV